MVSFRLSVETIKQLEQASRATLETRTRIIEAGIDRIAQLKIEGGWL